MGLLLASLLCDLFYPKFFELSNQCSGPAVKSVLNVHPHPGVWSRVFRDQLCLTDEETETRERLVASSKVQTMLVS